MIETKIAELPKVEWVKPVAFLSGDIGGVKMIAELPNKQFVFLLPPAYIAEEVVPDYEVQAAIAKYNYAPINETKNISSAEELIEFIPSLTSNAL